MFQALEDSHVYAVERKFLLLTRLKSLVYFCKLVVVVCTFSRTELSFSETEENNSSVIGWTFSFIDFTLNLNFRFYFL